MLSATKTTLAAAVFALGLLGCGGTADVEPDTSVTDSGFCKDIVKQCPGSGGEFEGNRCMTACGSGVKPSTKSGLGKTCWEIYCAIEIKDCLAAGNLTTPDSILTCARAHGWLLDD